MHYIAKIAGCLAKILLQSKTSSPYLFCINAIQKWEIEKVAGRFHRAKLWKANHFSNVCLFLAYFSAVIFVVSEPSAVVYFGVFNLNISSLQKTEAFSFLSIIKSHPCFLGQDQDTTSPPQCISCFAVQTTQEDETDAVVFFRRKSALQNGYGFFLFLGWWQFESCTAAWTSYQLGSIHALLRWTDWLNIEMVAS